MTRKSRAAAREAAAAIEAGTLDNERHAREPEPELVEAVLVEADIEILSGDPDADDAAAITAVIAEVLGELAAEQGRREQAVTSAWSRSQRAVRAPVHAQNGAWRSFSG